MKRIRVVLAFVLGIPAVLAFVFSELQWYPATIVIHKIADADGYFSMRRAVGYNLIILLLAELVLLLPVVLIVQAVRTVKKRRAGEKR